MNDNLSTKINEILIFLEMSRTKFAHSIGVSETFIRDICNNKCVPKKDIVSKICKKYNIDPEYFSSDNPISYYLEKPRAHDEINREIAERINEIRIERGFIQKDLVELTGISKSNISNILKGRYPLTANSAKAISKALNVGEEWLLTGNERNKHSPLNDEMIEYLMNHEELRIQILSIMNHQADISE